MQNMQASSVLLMCYPHEYYSKLGASHSHVCQDRDQWCYGYLGSISPMYQDGLRKTSDGWLRMGTRLML